MSDPKEINLNDFDNEALYGGDSPKPDDSEDAAADRLDSEEGIDFGAELDSPEAQIIALEADLLEMKDRLLRSMADKENIRKRAEKEKADTRVYAIEKFAGDLITVSDNLERANMSITADMRTELGEAGQALAEGVDMTLKALHTVLGRHGVKPIEATPGTLFDPNHHQAVSQIPSEHATGTIAMSFQPGWQIGGRTLRAAMVAVSAGQPASAAPTDETPPQSDQNSV